MLPPLPARCQGSGSDPLTLIGSALPAFLDPQQPYLPGGYRFALTVTYGCPPCARLPALPRSVIPRKPP